MHKNTLLLVILIKLLFLSSIFGQLSFDDEETVKVQVYQSFEKIHSGSDLKIAVKINIAEKWHINSHSPNEDYLIPTELAIKEETPFKFEKVDYPNAKEYTFNFSEKPVSVYEGEVLIGGVVKIPKDLELSEHTIPVEFTYQACNDNSCAAPVTEEYKVNIQIVDNSTQISQINSELFEQLDLTYQTKVAPDNDSIGSKFESSGLLLSLILVFIGGLALNLTPCVYPLIPITIGYFGGQSEGRTGKLFVLGVLYVLGMALTYSVIGVVTALSGSVFGTLLQNPFVIIGIVGVLIALSLSLFGVYEFKLPDKWVAKAGGAKSGAVGAFFMGVTMGIVAAPCIGPFVLALVTYVGAKGEPLYGFLMFFFMAVGLGLPYLFLALFSGKIKELPKSGTWMKGIEHIFGFILLGMAIYFLNPLLPDYIAEYSLPVLAVLSAIFLLFFDTNGHQIKIFRAIKTVLMVVIIGVSVYFAYPTEKSSPDWQKFDQEQYQSSLQNNKPIVVDFYADWCIPCKELDAMTFSDPDVIGKMKEFDIYKVDMTKTMSDRTEKIRNQFDIVGMPTIILINSEGEEVKRITGFVNAEEFLSYLNKIN